MRILALNAGSSSIKYRLFDSGNNFLKLGQGIAERIGQSESSISQVIENGPVHKKQLHLSDHYAALQALFSSDENLKNIEAVGHRVVHGGELYKSPVLINNEVVTELAKLAKLAPLHCQPNIISIEVLQKMMPKIPHVAIFDTAAHAEMKPKTFLYGLPMEFYEKYKIRKYGFHGINHSYVANEASQLLKKQLANLKIITCHLGNGCSISAFENGKSIENSMGFTPLEGLVMGTRCGDLDPSIILYLIEELKMSAQEITDLLNKKSGLLGLCEKSDMRDIIAMAEKGDNPSQLAIAIFVHRIQKYIGSYTAVLNGVDVIVFTGGIGENSPYIRSLIEKNLSYLGTVIDDAANKNNNTIFSACDSAVTLMTIPANEELAIAHQTQQLLTQIQKPSK